jgi:uncharacterized pyridoxal phosphate-containing UPF0001 family protein
VDYVARYAVVYGKTPYPIYISVNAAGEEQKSGLSSDDALNLSEYIAQKYSQELDLQGIMSVPPVEYSDPEDLSKPLEVPTLYKRLALLASNVGKSKLSLGMSGDAALSIAVGSTCLRIGTNIFGERN